MIVTIVHVHVKPEHVEDFINATKENHNNSIKEPGNLRFDVLQSTEDPTKFILYEAYISPEASARGPIAILRDGDIISIDIPNRKLEVKLTKSEIEKMSINN